MSRSRSPWGTRSTVGRPLRQFRKRSSSFACAGAVDGRLLKGEQYGRQRPAPGRIRSTKSEMPVEAGVKSPGFAGEGVPLESQRFFPPHRAWRAPECARLPQHLARLTGGRDPLDEGIGSPQGAGQTPALWMAGARLPQAKAPNPVARGQPAALRRTPQSRLSAPDGGDDENT